MVPVRKAVIPAAGLGTRFLPLTKAIPKELLPLVSKPVIQHIVEEATSSGITEIIFVISENKEGIRSHFDKNADLEEMLTKKDKHKELNSIKELYNLAQFTFVQQNEQLGLGHAVLQAKDAVGDEPFVVFGGDDVIDAEKPACQQLIDVYNEHGGPVMGVMEVPEDAVSRYGIADVAEDYGNGVMRLKDIVEKPSVADAPSRYGVGGRWLLTPDIFAHLETTVPGAGDEIQLTDAIRALGKERALFAKQYEGTYWDCGNKLEYIKAMISFSLKDLEFRDEILTYIKSLA